MKRWNQVMVALCVAAATAACAGDRPADRPADNAATATPGAVGTSGAENPRADDAASADRDFIGDMMADGQAEVMLGEVARQKARSARVKDFAAMMVRDHTKAGAELKAIATSAKVDLGRIDMEGEDHAELRNRLAKLSGAEFDREYMKTMVEKHEEAVNAVEDKAEGADNAEVKAWAAKTLPALKKHLEQAKQIHESLEKRSGT